MVITRSDSLKTATAANVYAYAIEQERSKATGKTTETKPIASIKETEPSAMLNQQTTNKALRVADILRETQESQPVKALRNYGGYDLRHSCYLSILV